MKSQAKPGYYSTPILLLGTWTGEVGLYHGLNFGFILMLDDSWRPDPDRKIEPVRVTDLPAREQMN